jgi:hypothetical protein
LEFEDSPIHLEINLSKSFWNRCRELRKREIREWLQSNGLDVWTKGKPPSLWLEPLGGQHFFALQTTTGEMNHSDYQSRLDEECTPVSFS